MLAVARKGVCNVLRRGYIVVHVSCLTEEGVIAY